MAPPDGRDASLAARTPDLTVLTVFVVLVLLVGTNLVAIRYTNRSLPPLWNAGLRFMCAAVAFGVIVAARRRPRPSWSTIVTSALYGVLAFGLFFGFVYAGLVEASAGLGQTVLALGPLITLLMAVAVGLERLRGPAIAGSVIALSGIVLSVGAVDQIDVPVGSVLALVAAATSFAAGGILVKLSPPTDPYIRNALATGVGAAILVAISAITGESWVVPSGAATWIAEVYLIIPGTVVVFSLFLYLLGRWDATRVSSQFVAAPIVAIVLGSWLLGESVTVASIAGTALVIVGVYVGAFFHAETGSTAT